MAKFLIPYFQIGHGLFNICLFVAFVYQGRLGWRIRRARKAGHRPDVVAIRRHRRLGPLLAALLPIGYLAGLLTSYLARGEWARYPLHLGTGTLLLAAVITTWLISRRIRAGKSRWRTPHVILGLVILLLFLMQIFLGLNVLL